MLFISISQAQPTDTENPVLNLDSRLTNDRPNWLYENYESCVADLVPARSNSTQRFGIETCSDSPNRCLVACELGDGGTCFSLASAIQDLPTSQGRYDGPEQALFQRACTLGYVAGCTNRGAGVMRAAWEKKMDTPLCAARTYKKACKLGDHWACIMHGQELAMGTTIDQNLSLAKTLLLRACPDPNSPERSCGIARDWLAEIEEAKASE